MAEPQTPGIVALDLGLAETLRAYLARFPNERGGVLIGRRVGDRVDIAAAVFPEQERNTGISCSFDIRVIDIVHQAIGPDTGVESILGWVHSHPWLGVFLSEQDSRTLSAWTDLDHGAVALVVDPHAPSRTFGVWGRQAVRRALRPDIAEAAPLDMAAGLAMSARLRTVPGVDRTRLWDVVCADGVLSVVLGAGAPVRVEEVS